MYKTSVLKLLLSMEVAGSPGKKKKVKKMTGSRPKKCIIHIVRSAKDDTLSTFTEQSWQVIICD